MLDADEASGFDEAMRHDPELQSAYREMDRLTTAVAVVTTVPIAPQAGQLERLQRRLGLTAAKPTNWAAISGWAAAAVLAMMWMLDRSPQARAEIATVTPPPGKVISASASPESATEEALPETAAQEDEPVSGDSSPLTAAVDADGRSIARVEAKRLIQEIEVLRENLESFKERDRVRFEAVPGMAWPVVMRMGPPGVAPEPTEHGVIESGDQPPITAMLADALAGNPKSTSPFVFGSAGIKTGDLTSPIEEPSAIPIYDAARDSGTLVVSNLPPPPADETYNLWVKPRNQDKPIYVGRLPQSNARGAESFDFSLGSTVTVPSSFVLTKDRLGEPAAPTQRNTVLLGPR